METLAGFSWTAIELALPVLSSAGPNNPAWPWQSQPESSTSLLKSRHDPPGVMATFLGHQSSIEEPMQTYFDRDLWNIRSIFSFSASIAVEFACAAAKA
jgi:hypothetical protein